MNTFLGTPAVINDGHNYWLLSADGSYSRTIRCRAVQKHILKICAGEARLEHATAVSAQTRDALIATDNISPA